jgi:hypothetical protein
MHEKNETPTSTVPRPKVSTVCPFSGLNTSIERELDPELGAVSLDELETLVRNEWRRRLGASSYRREHSRSVIRALILCTLDPDSPVRSTIAQQLVLWELTKLGTWGMSRVAIMSEFQQLSRALGRALIVAGMDVGRSGDFANTLRRKLDEILQWPHPDTTETREA